MNQSKGFKKKLAEVSQLWESKEYDRALGEVEVLTKAWPGNAHLQILWANLVQFQSDPKHTLGDVKRALQCAVELGRGSPAGAIELGYFLDNVEDDPQAAVKAFEEAVAASRQYLIEALIAQARVFRQLEKKAEFRRCVSEVLYLAECDAKSKSNQSEDSSPTLVLSTRYGNEIEDLLSGETQELP